MIEKIAKSNNEQYGVSDNLKKVEEKLSIDYKLDSIDEKRFQKFKEMVDYIKKNGGEYGNEYKDIMDKVIDPFEEKIQSILGKNTEELNSMSDDAINTMADERMKRQPQELVGQQGLIRKINNNGSSEEIQKLNEIVNENMADVQGFYDKVLNNINLVTISGGNQLDLTTDSGAEGGYAYKTSDGKPPIEEPPVSELEGQDGDSGGNEV